MAKWIAIVLGILLIATNGFWLYSAIDMAVTDKYRQQEEYEAKHRIEALEKLCSKLVGGMKEADAIKLLNEISPDFEAYKKEGHLNAIWLSFRVDEDGNVSESGACKQLKGAE